MTLTVSMSLAQMVRKRRGTPLVKFKVLKPLLISTQSRFGAKILLDVDRPSLVVTLQLCF